MSCNGSRDVMPTKIKTQMHIHTQGNTWLHDCLLWWWEIIMCRNATELSHWIYYFLNIIENSEHNSWLYFFRNTITDLPWILTVDDILTNPLRTVKPMAPNSSSTKIRSKGRQMSFKLWACLACEYRAG